MNVQVNSGSDRKASANRRHRIAIIGGGPGGLFSAWHLAAKLGDTCQITVYEADARLGGKILTKEFAGVGPYEAGVAEIYDYSRLGPDPLRDLIVDELELDIKHLRGGPCVLDGRVFGSPEDLAEAFGERTREEVVAFRDRCASLLSPDAYYLAIRQNDNSHPWSSVSAEAMLNREIQDEAARRYVRVMAHSDVAAPPHQTNGLTFLKNVVMDIEGYMDIFSVVGGNEQIVERLTELLDADLRTGANVAAVAPRPDGTFQLQIQSNGLVECAVADFVVVALPLTALSNIHWRGEALRKAIDRHISHFDRPGHYLRATLLFKRPFWREQLATDWWMLDAFDGCCVYDESARHEYGGYGALAFLIAGNAALALANVSDERIEQLCLDALPPSLAEGANLIIDRRIHRWMASVNAIPGGMEQRPRQTNHHPDSERLPGLVMVGDYIFDATLNGVLDSADAASDIILVELLKRRHAAEVLEAATGQALDAATDWLSDDAQHGPEMAQEAALSQDDVRQMLLNVSALENGARFVRLIAESLGKGRGGWRTDSRFGAVRPDPEPGLDTDTCDIAPTADAVLGILQVAWGLGEGSRVLLLGARAQRLTTSLESAGLQVSVGETASQPRQGGAAAYLTMSGRLPFEDQAFDAVVDTSLCELDLADAAKALEEIRRVSKHGFVFGSITSDPPIDLLERRNVCHITRTIASRWEWSELIYPLGFVHALSDPFRLAEAWRRVKECGAGAGTWCEDAESLLYSVYGQPPEPLQITCATETLFEHGPLIEYRRPATAPNTSQISSEEIRTGILFEQADVNNVRTGVDLAAVNHHPKPNGLSHL